MTAVGTVEGGRSAATDDAWGASRAAIALRVAKLDHERRRHAVHNNPVEESSFHQRGHARRSDWREIGIGLNAQLTRRCFEYESNAFANTCNADGSCWRRC